MFRWRSEYGFRKRSIKQTGVPDATDPVEIAIGTDAASPISPSFAIPLLPSDAFAALPTFTSKNGPVKRTNAKYVMFAVSFIDGMH